MSKRIDLTGQKFEKLKVISYVGTNKNGQALWECEYKCGKLQKYLKLLREKGVEYNFPVFPAISRFGNLFPVFSRKMMILYKLEKLKESRKAPGKGAFFMR